VFLGPGVCVCVCGCFFVLVVCAVCINFAPPAFDDSSHSSDLVRFELCLAPTRSVCCVYTAGSGLEVESEAVSSSGGINQSVMHF